MRLTQHLTAEELFSMSKPLNASISLETVYHNLHKLCIAGMIRNISIAGQSGRYDRIVRHNHVVWQKCGKLVDICFPDLTEILRQQMHDDFFFMI